MAGENTHIAGMAGRYATALFELARDQNELDATAAAFVQLKTLLSESDELRHFIRSPVFSAEQQGSVVGSIVEKADFPTLTRNFLRLLVRNRRLFALQDIIGGFLKLVAGGRNELTAEVTTAIPLTDAHTQELIATLKAKTGKDVTLNEKVDPALLGGLIVRIGSRMVDSSIRTKLNNLKIVMKEVG